MDLAGRALAAVRYVDANSTNDAPPYTNWGTAAAIIQDAVDTAAAGDEIVVTNGVCRVGKVETYGSNRVALTNAVTVRSVNGPEVTVIEGATNSVRCAYVGDGAVLSGFTLTKGTAGFSGNVYGDSGGGVWCESSGVVTNCVLKGNWAYEAGGGTFGGTLYNCTLTGNSASPGVWGAWGGGADASTLYNCTLTGNSADVCGGGASANWPGCRLYNYIVYFNRAPEGANHSGCTFEYSCTTPLPANGVGNITNAPLFVDYANGNFRLQSNSPCINAGLNAYALGPTDLDGLPRIVSSTVDIGAYEFQGPGSVISYAWLQQYGLPTDGSADSIDSDHDGMNNWQEWLCGTCPTNAQSALRILSAAPAGTNVTVTWQSVAGVSYFLERSTNLAAKRPFSLLATSLSGQSATTSFTDTNAAALNLLFYRVGVGN